MNLPTGQLNELIFGWFGCVTDQPPGTELPIKCVVSCWINQLILIVLCSIRLAFFGAVGQAAQRVVDREPDVCIVDVLPEVLIELGRVQHGPERLAPRQKILSHQAQTAPLVGKLFAHTQRVLGKPDPLTLLNSID